MTLSAHEFIRRFLLHTLPDGFHRIRHFGFLANGHRRTKLELCRKLLAAPAPNPVPKDAPERGAEHTDGKAGTPAWSRCPCCGRGLVVVGTMSSKLPRRSAFWNDSS